MSQTTRPARTDTAPVLRPVVVADVGGTNTRVALARGRVVDTSSIRRYRNAGVARLEDLLRRYLDETAPGPVGGACVALAGPVRGGAAQMTNFGWTLTEGDLAAAIDAPAQGVALLNDLQAQGQALDSIAPGHLQPLRAGTDEPGAARLVIGFGTGVNAAAVQPLQGGRGWLVPPAEAGHIHLPVADDTDAALAAWMRQDPGFASVEDVLAGSGLERLYRFHAERDGARGQLDAAAIMAGIDAADPLALTVGAHYIRLMARYTALLALVHLPFGGIYVIGGVARAFAPHAEALGFDAAFCQMGRFSDFVAGFSVSVLTDDFAALTGCAAYLDALALHRH